MNNNFHIFKTSFYDSGYGIYFQVLKIKKREME